MDQLRSIKIHRKISNGSSISNHYYIQYFLYEYLFSRTNEISFSKDVILLRWEEHVRDKYSYWVEAMFLPLYLLDLAMALNAIKYTDDVLFFMMECLDALLLPVITSITVTQ